MAGAITFDLVPTDKTSGLLYANIVKKPTRGIVVEAINSTTSAVLASATTDDAGLYSVAVPNLTNIKIRAKAQMLKTGSPSWDFQVVDNTNGKALYTMESAPFDTGVSGVPNKNLNAASGWGSASYTSTRAAAPLQFWTRCSSRPRGSCRRTPRQRCLSC